MGASESSGEVLPIRCTVRNQTGDNLVVRTYPESAHPFATVSHGGETPPYCTEYVVRRNALVEVGVDTTRGCNARPRLLLAVKPTTSATAPSGAGRGAVGPRLEGGHVGNGRSRGGGAGMGRTMGQCGEARLVAVRAGIEISVNSDRTGQLIFRTFCKEPPVDGADAGGTWKVLVSESAVALFPQEARETVGEAAPGARPESAVVAPEAMPLVTAAVDEDDDEEGLYLTCGERKNALGGEMDGGEAWPDAADASGAEAADSIADDAVAPPLPPECVCPISHELFNQPVLAADGFTYERRCIEAWFSRWDFGVDVATDASRGMTPAPRGKGPRLLPKSPMTGRPLDNTRLIPNLAIQSLCRDYRARWGDGLRPHGASSSACPSAGSHDSPLPNAGRVTGSAVTPRATQSEALKPHVGAFDAQLPAFCEMFAHLPLAKIQDVCAEFSAAGVADVDQVVRRLLQCSEAEQTDDPSSAPEVSTDVPGGRPVAKKHNFVAGVPFTAMAMEMVQKEATDTTDGGGVAAIAASTALDSSVHAPFGFEALHHALVEVTGFGPVAARKAILVGHATTIEEAVEWLEKHQDDADLEVPEEELEERENYRLYLAVMRVSTVPKPEDRMECYILLHKILRRIMEDPDSARVRRIRLRNSLFRRRVLRFPPAMALLRLVGFKQGDFWTSHKDHEPCVEFALPVDSDNPTSVRFVRVFTILDEMMSDPDSWLGVLLGQASDAGPPEPSLAARIGGPRERLAELHEWRARDPRGFEQAMRAQGKPANRTVVNITQRKEPAVPVLGEGNDRYRSLRERYGGRREFNLNDIEQMRTDDAIRGATLYAEEYLNDQTSQATSSGRDSYSSLRNRCYDPQYLGRVCVDRTNAFRAQNRLPPLHWNQQIFDVAVEHAQQMARGKMPFSHLDFDKRVARFPFVHLGAGENLAYNGGHLDAAVQAVQQWIDSPGHRKNLLGTWNLCAVGVAQVGSMFYFTQLFARTGSPLA